MEIKNFEHYSILRNGDVITEHFSVIKPYIDPNGFLRIRLRKNGKIYTFAVHRILAQHYLENNNGYKIIVHINGDKLDNRLENLKYSSKKTKEPVENLEIEKEGIYKINDKGRLYLRACITKNKQRHVKNFQYSDTGYELAQIWRDNKKLELSH